MRPGVRFLGIGAGFVLFFALVFSIVSTGHEARADTTPLKISIGYISEAIPEPDPLSLVEIVPKDKGIAGLRLAIEDDNTTGKFLKQTYELTEKVVPQGGDLHPRPQTQRARWTDLNGTWQFAYDDDDRGRDVGWQERAEAFDRQIVVPFPPESEMSGIGDTGFHPVVWYRREFSAQRRAGERLLLHFGAVDYRADVWVNGQLVASHEGGHSSFSADIAAVLAESGAQVVVVRAEDQPGDVAQPRGKQDWYEEPHAIWYSRTTGIWQTVWLEPVPELYIAELQLTPDLATGSVRVEAVLNRQARGSLEIDLSIVVEVARPYASAIVEVHILQHIDGVGLGELVGKMEAGAIVVEHFEQGRIGLITGTATDYQ